MFNISKEFAPPFKLIAPFFIAGVFFYLLSTAGLIFYDTSFHFSELRVAGWVHLFMLGFVMMIIFGAMAQLVPVVLETGHFSVDWYYVIFPLLLVGVVLLVLGFWFNPILLSFGGLLVLSSMLIFSVEVFLTIKKSELNSFTVRAVKISNIFLLFGILSGFLLALSLSGFSSIDLESVLRSHFFAVVGGYVMITIYGIALILLPMFGLAHGFEDHYIVAACRFMVLGVIVVIIGNLLNFSLFIQLGYLLTLLSVGLYFIQILLIFHTRARKEYDIWFKSMLFAHFALLVGWIGGLLYLLSGATLGNLFYFSIWSLFTFFIFLIVGHLYKIIPFLVWFHRFSPLVGKKRVPMLHEMYPKKQAEYEFWFSVVGAILVGLSFLFKNDQLLKAGASFLFIGAIFLATSVKFMFYFGRGKDG
ncbi:MAG: hypothetical protein GXO61_05830 [Epsilonproteobacteria bacterium]|nr:hypothetical protein [Campylobacterota bacterium]